MAVSYKKLFHLMIDNGMTNAELMEKGGFSANIITRLKRNNYVYQRYSYYKEDHITGFEVCCVAF